MRPGDPSRLLVYLYGGGACWDAEGCAEGSSLYFERIEPWMHPEAGRGILDLEHPDNLFRDHTMVAVPYCTGDTHLGDRDEVYVLEDNDGSSREFTIRHRGQVNVDSALDWIYRNVPGPREIFVSGLSAGGVGVAFHASRLAGAYPAARVTGLGDGAGTFSTRIAPEGDPARWGLPEVLRRHPDWERFPERPGVQDLYILGALGAPNLRLYQVDHAHDANQTRRLRQSGHPDPDILEILRAHRSEIQAQVPAFRSFILGGDRHGVLPNSSFFLRREGDVRLRDWVAAIAAGQEVPDVECGDCSRPGFAFDENDVRILEQALELLAEDAAWEPHDPGGDCPGASPAAPSAASPAAPPATRVPLSLRCAVSEAVRQTTGQPPGYHAAPIDVQYTLEGLGTGLREFNNHPETAADDVRALLREVLGRARRALADGGSDDAAPDIAGDVSTPAGVPALAELAEGWNTLEPGGRTACAHGTDYVFYARPGDPARLMVYLYGGGACWDAEGCAQGSGIYTDRIRSETHPDELGGILDHGNAENPFAEHVMVAVPVCTGDVHLGDRDTAYVASSASGAPEELRILHRGQVNAGAAVEWIHRNVPAPREIFVAGSSAGSLAVPLYASRLALHYPQARVTGVGDDTGGLAGGALPDADPGRWGVPEVLQRHEGWEDFPEGWGMEGLFITGAQAAPNVRLFQVNHAHDPVQRFYLERAGARDPDVQRLLRASIDRIRAQVPEFRSFTLGGFSHTVLQQNGFYRHQVDGLRLRDWIGAVAAGEAVPSVDCGDCLHPSLAFDEDDRRIVERALEILADDEAWLSHDPGGPCPAEADAFSVRCAMSEAVRQVTGRSPDDHAAPMDLYYLGRAHAREGPGGPLARLNNDLNGDAEGAREIFRDLLARIQASLPPAPVLEPSPCPFELPDELMRDTECGWVTVPENWSHPEGRSIRIPVAVLRARSDDPRPEALVHLAGGPMPVLVGVEGLARSALRQERDLVVFDYRGLGYGEQVCPDAGPGYLQMLSDPLTPDEARRATRRLAEACRRWADEHGVDLAMYDARAMAMDAVAVVRSLGYDRWSLTGGSFGTAVIQEVLRLNPPGLRAVAVMGPVPAGIEALSVNPMARALEVAWRYCREDPDCAATFPDPAREYEALFHELNREPLPVPVDGIGGRVEDPFWLDGRTLHRLVLQMLYDRATLAAIPFLVRETARGNVAPAADLIQRVGPLTDHVTGATWAAHCPLLGAWAEGFDLTAPPGPDDDHFRMEVKIRCPALGLEPAPRPPVESDIPVLVIVGEHDPVTPPAYAHAFVAGLTNAHVLEIPGRGHEMPPECGQVGIPAFLDDPSHIPRDVCVEGLEDVPFMTQAPDPPAANGHARGGPAFAAGVHSGLPAAEPADGSRLVRERGAPATFVQSKGG